MTKKELFSLGIKAAIEGYRKAISNMAERGLTQEDTNAVIYKTGIIQGLIIAREMLIEVDPTP